MPNTKSAKKRLKQNMARRTRNRATKSALKTQLRKVRDAVTSRNLDVAATEQVLAAKKLDQAAAKGVIHPNRAARLKSRIAKAMKSAKGIVPKATAT